MICVVSVRAQLPEGIRFQESCRFHPGDDPSWARPDFDDSAWLKVPVTKFPYDRWKGIAWLRYVVEVRPSLWDVPLALRMRSYGAAEFYVNGRLIHRFGIVGSSKADEVAVFQRYPKPIFFRFMAPPASTGDVKKQIIAVRLSDFFREDPVWTGNLEISGFKIEKARPAYDSHLRFIRLSTINQILMFSLCLAFAVLHLLLFTYYPRFRPNLYYSLFTMSGALVLFFDYQQIFLSSPKSILLATRLNFLGIVFIAVTGVLFIHSLFYTHKRKIFTFFCITGSVICLLIWIRPFVFDGPLRIFLILSMLEIFWTIIAIRLKKIKALYEGTWIIALGLSPLMIVVMIEMICKLAELPFPWKENYVNAIPHYGILGLLFSMSVFLARNFSQTKKDLERRTQELQKLNVELEERVGRRTKELADANSVLEQKNIELERSRDEIRAAHKELKKTYDELRQTQTRLIQSEKMATLGNLVAGVAHEINSPIGAVSSTADTTTRSVDKILEILDESIELEGLQQNSILHSSLHVLKENSKIISMASERIKTIIQSLKNFARLDEAEFSEADLHEGMDNTLTLLQHDLKNRVKVVKKYGRIPKLYCNPGQINQVFMNIIRNASQAIKDCGTITIRTEKTDDNLIIRIADDGAGIKKESLERIFDPGFTTREGRVGMGLGLSISYNIVKNHGGEIVVKSQEDEGTEFIIKLPIRKRR